MYLDGKDIMKHTNELVDAMWESLPRAYVGFVGICLTPMVLIVPTLFTPPWEPPIGYGEMVARCLATVAIASFGLWLAWPWLVAVARVREHRANLVAETKRRGKYWAKS